MTRPALTARSVAGSCQAVAEWDLRTDSAAWSPTAYRMLGRNPALGPLSLDRLPGQLVPQDRPVLRTVITDALVHGRAGSGVIRIRRPDGRVARLTCHGEPRLDGDGRATALRMLLGAG